MDLVLHPPGRNRVDEVPKEGLCASLQCSILHSLESCL